ncbi:MAG: hypothetical protein JRL30_05480 [Deltaproteobacteria bacterium]|nr:hypothetical protein [Deltaproteobacteria bacterium]
MPLSLSPTCSYLPVRNLLKWIAILSGLALSLSACAAIQNQNAIDTERLLAASGFQMRLADNPEKLAHLKALTQRKLVPHKHEGKLYYVYADATSCQCIYVGNPKAYQRYQKLALQKQIADEQRMAAEMNENASMNWGLWGPWGPWGPAGPWE